jgi:hypothetical protein
MQKLKMQKDQLNKYIAEHSTLISELGWDKDSEMSRHSFRQGLPDPLAKRIIENEGLPESLWQWVRYTQMYHSRWAMNKALGYSKSSFNKNHPQWNLKVQKRKERDPDAMDVN